MLLPLGHERAVRHTAPVRTVAHCGMLHRCVPVHAAYMHTAYIRWCQARKAPGISSLSQSGRATKAVDGETYVGELGQKLRGWPVDRVSGRL